MSNITHGEIAKDAHNFYLKILTEEGLFGLVLFLIFIVTLFVLLLKKAQSKIPHIAFTARCLIGIFLLGNVVNFFLASKAVTWMYFLLPCGMLIGLNRETERNY